jgi:ribosomal protein RSM22 (predicted rRNA methylase)
VRPSPIDVPEAFVAEAIRLGRAALPPHVGTLADAVAALSASYTRERAGIERNTVDRAALAARLAFFLPRDLPKVAGPLAELHERRQLPSTRRWRVLDLGAGVGATTFGLARFVRVRDLADRLDVVAVDRFRAGLDAMTTLASRARDLGLVDITLEPATADFTTTVFPPNHFDLVLIGLALNELGGDDSALDTAFDMLGRAALSLREDGSIVIVEPGLRETTRWLQRLRDRIAADERLRVFAPCLRRGPCPMLASPRDWCHAELEAALPSAVATLARSAGLRDQRLSYSYLTLRNAHEHEDLASLADAATGRLGRVVSQPLPSKGKLELFVCSEAGLTRLSRLDRHRAPHNRALDETHRGDVLVVDPPLTPGAVRLDPAARVNRRASGAS